MSRSIGVVLAALVGAVVVGLAFFWAYDNTLTRHEDLPAGSSTEVVLDGEVRGAAEADLDLTVRGLVAACQLEVKGRIADGGLKALGGGRFRFVLRPGIDTADRRQLEGCLEDWRVDGLTTKVVTLRTHVAGSS